MPSSGEALVHRGRCGGPSGDGGDDSVRFVPRIEVEPDTFTVRVDGAVVEAAPAVELPMAQRYFLF